MMRAPTVDPGFPFGAFRRDRFAAGLVCPRCHGRRVHRWGRFADRQRYRCLDCRRTFSDFTGTPLAHLKHVDRWLGFLDCVEAAASLRASAAQLHLHVSTTFRWRHRLLAALRASDTRPLHGDIALLEIRFPFSEKGRRNLDRPARRHGQLVWWPHVPPLWVVLARDTHDRSLAEVIGPRRPEPDDLARTLRHRIHDDAVLLDHIGPYGALARFARQCALRSRPTRRLGGNTTPAPHHQFRRLRRWIRRFRGVASRYLPHYLVWHRFTETRHLHPAADSRTLLLLGAFP